MMVMADASKWYILQPAQSHTAGQDGGRAQQRLPPPLLACAQQSARCGGRLGVYYTFWRVSEAGPSTSCPAGTHMLPGEQGRSVCAKSGVLKQARRAPTAEFARAKNRSRPKHQSEQAQRIINARKAPAGAVWRYVSAPGGHTGVVHTAKVVYLLSTPHARATAAPASASLVFSAFCSSF